jgi:hypothetical protein
MKSSIFCDITSYSPLKVNKRFGGIFHLHLQGRIIGQARSQHKSLFATYFHAGFLLGLFFDPEDGGEMFLRNVSLLSKDYTALYPIWQNSSRQYSV